ncbi:hypothetical protein LTR94_032332, partial [Friedmanniomyces endolithicus]
HRFAPGDPERPDDGRQRHRKRLVRPELGAVGIPDQPVFAHRPEQDHVRAVGGVRRRRHRQRHRHQHRGGRHLFLLRQATGRGQPGVVRGPGQRDRRQRQAGHPDGRRRRHVVRGGPGRHRARPDPARTGGRHQRRRRQRRQGRGLGGQHRQRHLGTGAH